MGQEISGFHFQQQQVMERPQREHPDKPRDKPWMSTWEMWGASIPLRPPQTTCQLQPRGSPRLPNQGEKPPQLPPPYIKKTSPSIPSYKPHSAVGNTRQRAINVCYFKRSRRKAGTPRLSRLSPLGRINPVPAGGTAPPHLVLQRQPQLRTSPPSACPTKEEKGRREE